MKKSWEEIKQDIDMKLWSIRYKAQVKARQTIQWASEHQELALALIPAGVAIGKGLTNLGRSIEHNIALDKEQEFKEKHVYDHSLGMYHELRRKPNAKERAELSSRIANGEKKVDVLADMGLLKK